jgi:hypothetical protein
MYLKTFEDFRQEVQPISKHSDRVNYFHGRYDRLGRGTARAVYDMKDGTVVKVARNPKGIAQNKTESNPRMLKTYGDILAKVLDYHPKGKWIVQEKVDDITEKEFEELTGYQWDGFVGWLRWKSSDSNNFYKNKKFPVMVSDFISDYSLDRYDISDITSWGKNSDGKVVIKDYGLDMSTARKLYKVAY